MPAASSTRSSSPVRTRPARTPHFVARVCGEARPRRRDDDQPPGHGRLLPSARVRGVPHRGQPPLPGARQRRALGALPRRPRASPSPTRSPASRPAPRRSSARSTASASAPATRRSRRSSWPCASAPGALRRRRPASSRRRDRPRLAARRGADGLRASSGTRRSSARTRSPTRPASTRTGCSRTPRRTRSWIPPSSASSCRCRSASTPAGTPSRGPAPRPGSRSTRDGVNEAFARFKQLADTRKHVTLGDVFEEVACMRKKRYTVACLSGDGIGPEVMAEASRALASVSRHARLRGRRGARPVRRRRRAPVRPPAAARRRGAPAAEADAVLVAATREPALEGVKAELDLRWRIDARARSAATSSTIVSPLAGRRRGAREPRARSPRVQPARQRDLGRRERRAGATPSTAAAERWPGVTVEHVPSRRSSTGSLREPVALRRHRQRAGLRRARSPTPPRTPTARHAHGRLGPARAQTGRGMFGPTHGSALEIAGQGVANPSGMLLAAALMLGEGSASAAPPGRSSAVAETLGNGVRTPDMVASGVGATTREFMDVAARRAAGRPNGHRVRGGGAREDARLRRDSPLARGRGRRRRLRHPGRRDPPDLRRVRARHDRPPRARPPRAGRGPHGRGLRARLRAGRRRHRHVRARARRTSSRRSPTRGWTRRRSSASRARCART